MDIVEYAERFYGAKLLDWQKEHLRKLYDISRDNKIYIAMGKGGRVYTYLEPKTLKELIQNGQASNRCDQMSVMR